MHKKPIFALIPARSGSKGILNKNLYPVNTIPLIDFTISAALESSFIDEVYVSSDSKEILDHSKSIGAKTHKREDKYAKDSSPAHDVVSEFIDIYSLQDESIIIYLQPTSPLRTKYDIDKCINLMLENNYFRVISICENEYLPHKSFVINEGGRVSSLFDEEYTNYRRQDLPQTFYANGAIYGFSVYEFLKNKKRFPSNEAIPYIMPSNRSVDIDSIEDLKRVESILRGIKNNV